MWLSDMRNPLHSICPYFAMFPEAFVQRHLLAHSRPGDLVFDPFCGRGTTILESLLNGRRSLGTDINPVAACVAGAKARVPTLEAVMKRLEQLEAGFVESHSAMEVTDQFFTLCFSSKTLQQVLFLKGALDWSGADDDRFIAAVALGVLHGEAHKTTMCLSNRMPRTISTKPEYSIRWWNERGLRPPERDAFEVLRAAATFRLRGTAPSLNGEVVLADARKSAERLEHHAGKVALVITSPPYLDTTDYAEDQWLRLWFLGGPARPSARLHRDDRHTQKAQYWSFLTETWTGCSDLLADQATLVVRIGGTLLNKEELRKGLEASILSGFDGRSVASLNQGESSTIRRRQTNSFRPGTTPERLEHDFTFLIAA